MGPVRLRRFWFRFEGEGHLPFGLGYGCGVTAFHLDDALAIIEDRMFQGPLPFRIASTIEDVDVRTLDQGHVIPNMLPPNERGIWFPQGFPARPRD